MCRFVCILSLCGLLFAFGCGGITEKLVSKQEWSENYALMEGVRATSSQMIDGDLRTLGESVFPEGSQRLYGAAPSSEAIVILPERKMIRRVVIHSENLKEFDVALDKGNDNWKIIEDVKSVKLTPIDLLLNAPFPTDKIRIRVLGTSDDRNERIGGFSRFRSRRRAAAKITEIELYGYKSSEETETEHAEDQHEKELDELLQ